MFSGILAGTARINNLEKKPGLYSLAIGVPNAENYSIGASVAINGVCLTVTAKDKKNLYFDAMQETLNLTNIANLQEGDLVNYEPSIKFGDEIGGHLLSGHISTQAQIIDIIKSENNCQWKVQIPESVQDYIFAKGFVALDGASLTVGELEDDIFNLHLIPETLRATTFNSVGIGYKLNLEIDSQTKIIVDTVRKMQAN